MMVSVVIPVFNEAEAITLLWARLTPVLEAIPQYQFEVVFVDDGSSDASAALIEQLAAGPRVSIKLIRFSRNFGHQAAISAGMQYAEGDALVFLDADLQDPPELIAEFLKKQQEGYDVVYAVRQNRKESWLKRAFFHGFYLLFNALAQRPMPLDAGDFSLITRRVAQLIVQMPEHDRLIRGLRSWVGFKQIGIPYDRPGRSAGESRYGFVKHVQLALDGLFSFSKAPIRFALVMGLTVIAVGGVYLAVAYGRALLFGGTAPRGWLSLITLGLMVAGANIVATAIVGEYVARIYFQTKARPLYIVERVSTKTGEPRRE